MTGGGRFDYALGTVRSVAGIRQELAEDALRRARTALEACDREIRELREQRNARLGGIRRPRQGDQIDLDAYRALDAIVKAADAGRARLLASRAPLELALAEAMREWTEASRRRDTIDEHFLAERERHGREMATLASREADEGWLQRGAHAVKEAT